MTKPKKLLEGDAFDLEDDDEPGEPDPGGPTTIGGSVDVDF